MNDPINLIAVTSVATLMLKEDYGLRVSAMPSPWFEGCMLTAAEAYPNDPAAVAFMVAGEYMRSGFRAAVVEAAQ